MFLGLVEMPFGVVYASFSLPEGQAFKNDFLLHPEFHTEVIFGGPVI